MSMVCNAGVKLFSGFETEPYIVNFSLIFITLIFVKTCFITCQNRYALHTLQQWTKVAEILQMRFLVYFCIWKKILLKLKIVFPVTSLNSSGFVLQQILKLKVNSVVAAFCQKPYTVKKWTHGTSISKQDKKWHLKCVISLMFDRIGNWIV